MTLALAQTLSCDTCGRRLEVPGPATGFNSPLRIAEHLGWERRGERGACPKCAAEQKSTGAR